MAKNRKKAEEVILKWIDKIDPSGVNSKMYKDEIFPSLTNDQFDQWMKRIEDKKDYVFVNMPNFTGKKMSISNNLKVAKQMNVDLFQQITQTDPVTGRRYTGLKKYLILHLPVRRQIQMVTTKISVQSNDGKRDDLTGQYNQNSKGGRVTYPETLVLYSQQLDSTVVELLKGRGGDTEAGRMLTQQMVNEGEASLNTLDQLNTRAKSNRTLSVIMKAMHLDNNI